jgi:hypothetical protein
LQVEGLDWINDAHNLARRRTSCWL